MERHHRRRAANRHMVRVGAAVQRGAEDPLATDCSTLCTGSVVKDLCSPPPGSRCRFTSCWFTDGPCRKKHEEDRMNGGWHGPVKVGRVRQGGQGKCARRCCPAGTAMQAS